VCDEIEGIVGLAKFKSEEFLDEILNPQCPDSDRNHQWSNIVFAHEHSLGGFISGQVKLAITLRRTWIWHYCLNPASTTHTRLFHMLCRTG
jgi:hypothetical protein